MYQTTIPAWAMKKMNASNAARNKRLQEQGRAAFIAKHLRDACPCRSYLDKLEWFKGWDAAAKAAFDPD